MRNRSPAGNVDRIEAALMLVAGGPRRTRADAQADEHSARTRQTQVPATNGLLKDKEGHGFYRTDNNVELYTKMLAFLDRSLGKAAAAPAN